MTRIVLAMSGGVDSSVAAALLRAAGHEVIGVFMRHKHQPVAACATSPGLSLPVVTPREHKQGCCSAADAEDARRVADRLDVAFYAVNMDDDFGRVMDYFADEYTAGRTPNPCVMCNNWLKFGKLCDYADSIGAEFVASGHYARLDPTAAGGPALLRGVDADKDQSYVLFGLERSRLDRVLFPVGGFTKSEIRRRAREIGLRVAEKKDSQEICFVPDGDYAAFVRRRRGELDLAGEIVTSDGAVVGEHEGIERFTIGQRKGLGVAFGEPRYVLRIEPDTRRVVIGERHELDRDELTARDANWLVDVPEGSRKCLAQIRYNAEAVPARVESLPDARLRVVFECPQRGVAPGQAVVCYEGDRVLCGGWIE